MTPTSTATDATVAAVFREEAGRLTAALVRALGDFDLAEEVVQDSLVAALETWPKQGIPDKPGAWLMTTARRRAIDILRRDRRYRDKLALLERSDMTSDPAEADDRLRLIFTCCHPALSQEAQVALTLRAVAGFTTAEIASAFLVAEATVAQRIVRAKRKIVDANIPYRVPAGTELADRLDGVLSVLYLMFNEGYLSRGAQAAMRRDLANDALWLTRLVARLMPDQPEVVGLQALMTLNLARSAARFDEAGEMVLLPDQDRSRWDSVAIADGMALLDRAGAMHAPGPYQLQAAIAALHSEARSWADTDWHQIVVLYDALLGHVDSPVVRLNRAVALSHFAGPEVALGEVNDLALVLSGYHLFHSTRAELLDQLGEPVLAREARRRALDLCQNPAERSLLERKLRS
ncbi:MAG: RNA polymerase subunit sigma-24 [Actinobacteria bacterium 13_1_40CM_4_65_12]|nr:MAG: RNA polymerase subunit sigma-24 [Chloroflexi bacterium 13_1_40CM_65_17]OLC63685.1 MAG: RNA polymerase subunit sigma-24 [Actinobacteria bacterium 13_1_40CM_4_65_12]